MRHKLAGMKKFFFTVFLSFLLSGCTQIKSKPITEFSQKDINDAILLDVRTSAEFEEGHLEDAVNINWFDPDFLNYVDTLDRKKTVYIYCQKGGRSARAAKALDSLGFSVVDLLGGYSKIAKD